MLSRGEAANTDPSVINTTHQIIRGTRYRVCVGWCRWLCRWMCGVLFSLGRVILWCCLLSCSVCCSVFLVCLFSFVFETASACGAPSGGPAGGLLRRAGAGARLRQVAKRSREGTRWGQGLPLVDGVVGGCVFVCGGGCPGRRDLSIHARAYNDLGLLF